MLDAVGDREPVTVGQNVTDRVDEEHCDTVNVTWVDGELDKVGLEHGLNVGV